MPRITIGPTWICTIPLLIGVALMLWVYAGATMTLIENGAEWYYPAIGAVLILLGLYSFFYTLLGN